MIRGKGYELILGGSVNPQFGPVVLFGWGGTMVEVVKDSSLALPPLNTNLARLLIERTRVYQALKGTRGKPPVDLAALKETLVRFSRIMLDHPRIKEIDINPFLVSDTLQVGLDARVILHGRDVPLESLPRPAIRPYPSQYSWDFTLRDGRPVRLRPIRPEDEPLMVRFHGRLSERTVYQRYFETSSFERRVSHDRLARICFNDYDRTLALVAEKEPEEGRDAEIVAVARLTRMRSKWSAELAILVEDRYQEQGLGREMAGRLLQIASAEGVEKVVAHILGSNLAMRALCEELGFQLRSDDDGRMVVAEFRPARP
jgi:acetyltransferase